MVSEPDESLRVSDAERDVTLRTLGDHAAVGRLTLDELEERSGRALVAKTRGELAALTTDLPAGGAQPSGSAVSADLSWKRGNSMLKQNCHLDRSVAGVERSLC